MVDILRKISSDIRAMAKSIARNASRKIQQVHGTIYFRIGAFFMRLSGACTAALWATSLLLGWLATVYAPLFLFASERAGFKNPLQQEM